MRTKVRICEIGSRFSFLPFLCLEISPMMYAVYTPQSSSVLCILRLADLIAMA